MRIRTTLLWIGLVGVLAAGAPAARADPLDATLARLALPPGFHISVWAKVPNAREMAVAADINTVFVSDEANSIHAIRPGGPGEPARVSRVLRGLHAPSGVAYRDGWLYVAERTRLLRYRAADLLAETGRPPPEPEIVATGFPDKSHHGTRIVAIDPQGRPYVSIGTPCNLCQPQGIEGTILRFDATTHAREIFASGIRNSVGIAFQPGTGTCYFTDNGVDGMGDNSPPEELNRADRPGLFFGYPYYGGGHDRPETWAARQPPAAVTFPVVEFPAHVAPLGLAFYDGEAFPADFRGDLFVAQHGSWNRSIPIGYQVVRVDFVDGKPTRTQPFVTGWLAADEAVLGRPADVKQGADGALLISDDYNGAIYRVVFGR